MSSLGLPITKRIVKEQEAKEAGFGPPKEGRTMRRT